MLVIKRGGHLSCQMWTIYRASSKSELFHPRSPSTFTSFVCLAAAFIKNIGGHLEISASSFCEEKQQEKLNIDSAVRFPALFLSPRN